MAGMVIFANVLMGAGLEIFHSVVSFVQKFKFIYEHKITTCFIFIVETTTILKVLHHLADSTLSYSIDEQGIFPECFTYSQNQPLIVQLPEMRRLSGIQISSETSGPDLIIFPKGNF